MVCIFPFSFRRINFISTAVPRSQNFTISHSWNGEPLAKHDHIYIELLPGIDAIKMVVDAPFYNDALVPFVTAGQSFPRLWDYEG